MKWVGIDYGLARTGLAATDPEGIMAYPLTTIRLADYANRKEFLAALAGRILGERPDAVVMGLPLLTDGTESMTTRQVRNVTERLKRRVPLPFYFMSELLRGRRALTARGGPHGPPLQGRAGPAGRRAHPGVLPFPQP